MFGTTLVAVFTDFSIVALSTNCLHIFSPPLACPHPLPCVFFQSSPSGMNSGAASDFEQSLSNMSLRRARSTAPQPSSGRPLRNVGSSPQLLPLKQIHEEQEITSDDDALSTHSQTSMVRLRHSSLSMASPELARKILVSG